MTGLGASLAGTPTFPANAVADALRTELIASVRAIAETQGVAVPADDQSLEAHPFDLDSLVAVEALCSLDPVLPFPVTERVVKAGGYSSIKEAIAHITQRAEAEWQKHYSKVSVS